MLYIRCLLFEQRPRKVIDNVDAELKDWYYEDMMDEGNIVSKPVARVGYNDDSIYYLNNSNWVKTDDDDSAYYPDNTNRVAVHDDGQIMSGMEIVSFVWFNPEHKETGAWTKDEAYLWEQRNHFDDYNIWGK